MLIMDTKMAGAVSGGDIKKFVKDLQDKLNKTTLEVGFLDSKQATIAAKNEYGGVYKVDEEYKERAKNKGVNIGDTITIPPRPFMHMTFDNNNNKWIDSFKKLLVKNEYDVNKSLKTLGVIMQTDIQNTIRDGNFVENSARTVAIKGFNKPLIDSGDMLQSVTYEVHS
jgi:RNase H-fold protein (predicted Holliday junction resolvase)